MANDSQATRDEILDALRSMNHDDAEQWTTEGLPKMGIIEAALGDRSATRDMVTAAAPSFRRGRPAPESVPVVVPATVKAEDPDDFLKEEDGEAAEAESAGPTDPPAEREQTSAEIREVPAEIDPLTGRPIASEDDDAIRLDINDLNADDVEHLRVEATSRLDRLQATVASCRNRKVEAERAFRQANADYDAEVELQRRVLPRVNAAQATQSYIAQQLRNREIRAGVVQGRPLSPLDAAMTRPSGRRRPEFVKKD